VIEPRSRGVLDTRLRGYDSSRHDGSLDVIARSEAMKQSTLSLGRIAGGPAPLIATNAYEQRS
jgi:hypothetical protein